MINLHQYYLKYTNTYMGGHKISFIMPDSSLDQRAYAIIGAIL